MTILLHTLTVITLIIFTNDTAFANSYCRHLEGAKIYAQDSNKTFLGSIHHRSHPDSIFDTNNQFGNKNSITSIWNSTSIYGNSLSEYSAFNPSASSPPVMIKNGVIIGHISRNLSNLNSISAMYLSRLCKQFSK